GNANKLGVSGAVNLGFDIRVNQLQYGSAQVAYNWDCCGFNIEYRRFALASVRNENQFRFTFALANVGPFGNLRRGVRLFVIRAFRCKWKLIYWACYCSSWA